MAENPQLTKETGHPPVLTTTRALLTSIWTADVKVLDAALRRFGAGARSNGRCHVMFFEVAGDPQLHVNVTHLHSRAEVSDSTLAAAPPDGVVHGRAFARAPRYQILRQIRDMVFV